MAQWWIAPADGQVVIDDASIIGLDCSSIPNVANIFLVFWHGTYGEITYKHSSTMPVRERFINVAPYIPVFDKWIAASDKQTPPATLAQAKSVKSSMVHSLFESKRQAPIVVDGVTYDASDTNMATLMGSLTTDALIAAINAAIAQFNQTIATFNQAVDAMNTNEGLQDHVIEIGIIQNLNTDVAMLNSGSYVDAINTAVQSGLISGSSESGYTNPHTAMPKPQALVNAYGRGAVSGQVPVLGHLGTFPPVSLAQSTTGKVVNAISARTTQLASVRNAHLGGIAAQTTIAGVAAYNIQAGW